MSAAPFAPMTRSSTLKRGGVLDVGDHALVPMARAGRQAIELVGGHAAHRDVPLLGQADHGGQALVGTRRHQDRRRAPGAQRLESPG